MTATTPRVAALAAGRRDRARGRRRATIVLAALIVAAFAASLVLGDPVVAPGDVLGVLLGRDVPGAAFTVGELRLPRATLGLLAGFAFGIAGVTFQTMLRNPLASPDIIGISSGASAAAVVGIVVLGLDAGGISLLALGAALVTAATITLLAYRGGFAGARLILIGVGVAAMLDAVVSYVLSRAAAWDVQTAMQWLTGSLNSASWSSILPLACAFAVLVPVLLGNGRALGVLRLGDDSAVALGLRVRGTRILLILAAVALLAFATAASGPIAFVAFMSGPIAARIVGSGAAPLLPAGLVGALLVLVADFVGQNAFEHRYPVGVVTGVLGAPYLILLLVRLNRSGGSL
ncbi:iron chelate uptake ABC transporter family permease subunit [Leucobacter allii]|uniref:FecCD family ABC transporter permease n=1 Tax=Leucobacter allii TaxID=2932247 RepID=UPI001FD07048|nr:iron chelate uptake ABC transporter family permease subunit [Leucobacter allii]UOR00957.1 iron chelate uptake ABC transporter family permease subunit [Leucobacter allii]